MCIVILSYHLIFNKHVTHRYLNSFPTRRSSDLLSRRSSASPPSTLRGLLRIARPTAWTQTREPRQAGRGYRVLFCWIRSEEHTSELKSRGPSRMPSSACNINKINILCL